MKIIPYGRQYIDSQDIRFVSKALKEDLITTGSYVKKFENKISKFFKVKYSVSCNSGTSALHLALMAINLNKNDVIIMPAINFIAVYNMAKLMNAKIFLADVDSLTGQMTPKTLLECIKNNKLKKIKAIVTMYLGGYPENIIDFYNIKKKLNCYLIEDACHALGAEYLFKKKYLHIGSCKHSDISVFSLHPVKTITSGEGGLVTTNKKIFYNKIISLRSHGINKDKKFHWKYNIKESGYNYRLSDVNCALALSQLKKINHFINYRKKIFNNYRINFKKIKNLITLPFYKEKRSSCHLFLVSIKFSIIKSTKDKLLQFFKSNNIFFQYHYIPIYRFLLFNRRIDLKFYKGAETYYKSTISLPIFYNLTGAKQKMIIQKFISFFKKSLIL
jgi:UDP-4-amino-4,6-dideoxy-L-N-acetyl-beta-L-altrosamine transaminase